MPTASGRANARSPKNDRPSQGAEPNATRGPADGRCELCGCLPKKQGSLIFDREPERHGDVTTEVRRGWLCYHCKHLIDAVQTIGLPALVRYLIRMPDPVAGGTNLTKRQESDRKSILAILSHS
jgi:hypothetical protein